MRTKIIALVAIVAAAGMIAIAFWLMGGLLNSEPANASVSRATATATSSGVELDIGISASSVPSASHNAESMPHLSVNGLQVGCAEARDEDGAVIAVYKIAKASLPARSVSFSDDAKVVFEGYDGAAIASEINSAAGVSAEPTVTGTSTTTTTPGTTTENVAYPDNGASTTTTTDTVGTSQADAPRLEDISQLPDSSKSNIEATVKTIFRDTETITLEGLSDGGDGAYLSTVRSDNPELDGAIARFNEDGYLRSLVKDEIDYMN